MSRKAAALAVATVFSVSLAACGNGNGSASSGSSATQSASPSASAPATSAASASASDGAAAEDFSKKYDSPVTLTIGRQGVSGNNLPAPDTLESNDYLKYIQNKLNVTIKYDFSVEDTDAFNQKVNLAIASGNIPDVMIVSQDQFTRLAQAGLLEDLSGLYDPYLSPLIKDYYSSFGDRALKTAKVDGKLMALPNTNIDGNYQLLWVRKDWLDKLNLQVPATVDDLEAVAKAFKDQDPDGNGKNDTFGLLGDSHLFQDGGFFTFDPIFNAYHSYPDSWLKDASGQVSNGSIAPETKQALGRLREMYASGVIDKEFLTRKSYDDNAGFVSSGKAGLVLAPWYAGWMLSDSVKTDPKADWVPVPAPLDADGKRNVIMSSPASNFLVVKKGVEHPEAVLKVLSMEYQGLRLLDSDAANLYKDKGVSWLNWPFNLQLDYFDSVARSAAAYKQALTSNDTSGLKPWQLATFDSVKKDAANPKQDMPSFANSLAYYTGGTALESDKFNRIDPAYTGQTETSLKRGANLTKLENETFLKIITGQAPLDDFDKFVSQWKSIGGDQITKEVNDAVK
ncbi:extracellular solute-binding protein [Cohnella zeiphila]|uniref:Extracellular solute-binding protein n=1 Tax=Cohnella zeiphila TaxID=2761120 RepID=A0A7X0SRT0_9BACL|nr:extracellular solute-binding protein [Cohnella zeiphila]MBB6734771.1 extracellular solute-binding protein [Cohnella zeiphila]